MYATMFQHHKSAASVRGSCFHRRLHLQPSALPREGLLLSVTVGAPPQSVIAIQLASWARSDSNASITRSHGMSAQIGGGSAMQARLTVQYGDEGAASMRGGSTSAVVGGIAASSLPNMETRENKY
eukprot:SAG25_NODE_117_length_14819_cov_20.935670_20_plen_126_part_00